MLKVTIHTIKCDLVKGFNHPIRSGLIRGLWSFHLECHLVKGFMQADKSSKCMLGQPLLKGFQYKLFTMTRKKTIGFDLLWLQLTFAGLDLYLALVLTC